MLEPDCAQMWVGKELQNARNLLNGTGIPLATVDCQARGTKNYCLRQHVSSFPTTRIYTGRDAEAYEEIQGYKSSEE